MNYASIAGLDRPASRVILGSMAFKADTFDLSADTLDAFTARGGNLVDTAHIYRGGASERAIGNWLKRPGKRDQVLILTKGAHHDKIGKRVRPSEISFDLGQSLERLGASYVDLYVLHRDDPDVPVGPIVETLNEHLSRGRMKAIGGSNWTHQRVEEANAFAKERGLVPFAVSSPNLSLAAPNEPMWADCITVSGDQTELDWYRRTQTPLLSWSSQGGGFFSGRFRPDDPETEKNKDIRRVYFNEGNWERLRRAEQLGKELGSYTPTQIALAWVLNQPDILTFALIGPETIAELESSLDAAELGLTPEQVRWLNLED